MKPQKFKISIFGYLATGIVWLISIWAIIFIFDASLERLARNVSWFPLLLLLCALLLPSVFITWSLIVEMTTSYSSTGIRRLTLRGRKLINWGNIEKLQTGALYVDIKLARSVYRIPLLMYRNPYDLVSYLREQSSKDSLVS